MSNYNLGDIVALRSHPYDHLITTIIISGEPQLLSPLMVVIEILNDTRNQFDEKTGDEISKIGNSQCKCIWYSNKSHQFEEAWVSSKFIRHIEYFGEPMDWGKLDSKTLCGKLAVLRTADIEGKKQKSSISIENGISNVVKDKNTTTPLLSFVSPVMQISQIILAKDETKESLYDPKTGNKKRLVPKYLAKCKWYSFNDKLSEKLLPVECLKLLPEVDHGMLNSIEEKIISVGFFRSEKSIIQPLKIHSLNGVYILKAFDYLSNRVSDIVLTDKTSLVDIENVYINETPVFEFADGEILPENYFEQQYIDLIKAAKSKNNYLRIKYQNRLGIISTRTLMQYEIINITQGSLAVTYLKGYCMTKKNVRNFKISEIQKMQVLNLTF